MGGVSSQPYGLDPTSTLSPLPPSTLNSEHQRPTLAKQDLFPTFNHTNINNNNNNHNINTNNTVHKKNKTSASSSSLSVDSKTSKRHSNNAKADSAKIPTKPYIPFSEQSPRVANLNYPPSAPPSYKNIPSSTLQPRPVNTVFDQLNTLWGSQSALNPLCKTPSPLHTRPTTTDATCCSTLISAANGAKKAEVVVVYKAPAKNSINFLLEDKTVISLHVLATLISLREDPQRRSDRNSNDTKPSKA